MCTYTFGSKGKNLLSKVGSALLKTLQVAKFLQTLLVCFLLFWKCKWWEKICFLIYQKNTVSSVIWCLLENFTFFFVFFMHISTNLYLQCPNFRSPLYVWTHKYNSHSDISAFCTLKVRLCFSPASAARCVRPWLGGEGAGEGEPTSVHHSPAREVEVAVEQGGGKKRQSGQQKTFAR